MRLAYGWMVLSHMLDIHGYCSLTTVVSSTPRDRTLSAALGDAQDDTTEVAAGGRLASWCSLSPWTRLAHISDVAMGLASVHYLGAIHGNVALKQYLFRDRRLRLQNFNVGIWLLRNSDPPGDKEDEKEWKLANTDNQNCLQREHVMALTDGIVGLEMSNAWVGKMFTSLGLDVSTGGKVS